MSAPLPHSRPPAPEPDAVAGADVAQALSDAVSAGPHLARPAQQGAPKSVGSKLALMLCIYTLVGCVALAFMGKPVFALSLYLHSMTLVFLGMFVAASAGEVLFNKDEADILMHRPVTPQALLWAKIGVLVRGFALAGRRVQSGRLFCRALASATAAGFIRIAHAISTCLEALFCTGCVVMIYQLCLRWFGRERLDGLMTTAQVFVGVGAVLMGQLGPQLIGRSGLKLEVD